MIALVFSLLLLAIGSIATAMHGGYQRPEVAAEIAPTQPAALPVALSRGTCGHERHGIRLDTGRAMLGLSEPRAGGVPTAHARNEWVLPPSQAEVEDDHPLPVLILVIGYGPALAQNKATISPRGPPALPAA